MRESSGSLSLRRGQWTGDARQGRRIAGTCPQEGRGNGSSQVIGIISERYVMCLGCTTRNLHWTREGEGGGENGSTASMPRGLFDGRLGFSDLPKSVAKPFLATDGYDDGDGAACCHAVAGRASGC